LWGGGADFGAVLRRQKGDEPLENAAAIDEEIDGNDKDDEELGKALKCSTAPGHEFVEKRLRIGVGSGFEELIRGVANGAGDG
jgi:hypothetical protein